MSRYYVYNGSVTGVISLADYSNIIIIDSLPPLGDTEGVETLVTVAIRPQVLLSQ
jgi:hypothetical protein